MLNFEGVINPLSFGWISFGLAKELFNRNVKFTFFPIAGNQDWSAFDNTKEDFKQYVNSSSENNVNLFNINNPSLKLWHINPQSLPKLSKTHNSLLTFHELDSLTSEEVSILNSFDSIFVTSTYSKNVFESCGVQSPVFYVPMGLDSEVFYDLGKPRPFPETIVFSIFGKWEKRKWTTKTIQAWVSKYGNNAKYKLHCYITNPFFKPEQMNQVFAQIFENKPKPFNVDLFPYLPTNSHLNAAYNSTDIVIDMSGGESISLPSLNCIAMGKHGVVHYNTGIKDWATKENAVLISSKGKEPVYDGVFFHQGHKTNQGNIFQYNTDDFLSGCDIAIQRFLSNPINLEGKKLYDSYSFKHGVDSMLKNMPV